MQSRFMLMSLIGWEVSGAIEDGLRNCVGEEEIYMAPRSKCRTG